MSDDDGGPTQDATSSGLLGTSRTTTSEEDEQIVVRALDHLAIEDRDEFRRHFESLTRLDHPNLARFRDLDIESEPVEVSEEYVDGSEFLAYLRREPELEEIRTLQRRLAEEGRTPAPESGAPSEAEAETSDDESATDESTPAETRDEQLDEDSGPELDPGAVSPAGEKSTAEEESADENRPALMSETPTPGTHRYSEAAGDDTSNDVVRNPPEDHDAREVEHIDVVFLRLERLMPQILGGLEYLHRFQQPHGTLKPTNLLVEREGRCKISEYGLLTEAELIQDDRAPSGGRPPSESALEYARAYLAPECRANFEPSPEADLYALGCILFEAVTGCRPYEMASPETDEIDGERGERPISEELESVEQEHRSDRGDAGSDRDSTPNQIRRYTLQASGLSELEPRCPATWADLILRLLDSNPEKRPDFEDIRNILASTRGRSVDIPPSFIPEQTSFFGRDEIFEQLVDNAHRCVNAEKLQATVLEGAAGYGKTALADRLGQWAARRGWVVLQGRCYDQESLIYQGWNAIASDLGAICRHAAGELDEQTEPLRRRAAHLFPDLHPEGPSEAPFSRLDAVHAFRELLRVVAAERPVLLMIDDLNAATPDTIALLADLIGEPEQTPCMVISTWRHDPSHDEQTLPEELTSAPTEVDAIDIRGFQRAEAEAYVDTVADLDPELRHRVLEIGGTNPLLLKELIYQIHLKRPDESGARSDDDTFELVQSDQRELDDPDRPPGDKLTDLIRDRLAGLSRRETFVVQILSIVSLPIPESVISFVVDQEFHAGEGPGDSIGPLLDQLRTKRLVKELQSERWSRTYTLFHDLTRRVVLDDIPVQRYTHLCDHLADGLRRLWSDADELHFEYLLRADRKDEAIDAAMRTAHRAESRFAYHRAAQMWRWLGEQQNRTSRMTSVEASEELARVEYLARRYERAASLLHELAEEMPADVPRTELKAREFEAHLASGHRRNAIQALDGGLEWFGDRYERSSFLQKFSEWKNRAVAATQRWSDTPEEVAHEPLGRTETLRLKLYRNAVLRNDLLDSTRGERFHAKFSAIAEQSRDALLLGYDRLFLARDCHYYGVSRRSSRADEWYERTEHLFEVAEDSHGLALTATGRARLSRSRGAFDAADEWLDEAASRLEGAESNEDRDRYAISYERARIHRGRGNLGGAITRASKLRHFHRGHAVAEFRANQVLLPVRLLRGELSHAEFLIDECREFFDDGPPCVGTVWLARQRTRLNLARGRPEVARGFLNVLNDDLRNARLMSHPYVHLIFRMTRAQALIAQLTRKDHLGEPRRGELFGQIRDDVESVGNHSATVSSPLESEIQRLCARFELLRDNSESAFDHLDQAQSELAQYPDPIERSMCAEAQGLAFQQTDPERGASLIEQSRVIYDHHGCHYPLVLEGWPITERISKLDPDPQ